MYHKELIKEYFKNEETNPDEYKNWQYRSSLPCSGLPYDGETDIWVDCKDEPNFSQNKIYRRVIRHPHAELMMQYAQDAMATDEPWKLWEEKIDCNNFWKYLDCECKWLKNAVYRRKS